jgi:DnaK suppressor protein
VALRNAPGHLSATVERWRETPDEKQCSHNHLKWIDNETAAARVSVAVSHAVHEFNKTVRPHAFTLVPLSASEYIGAGSSSGVSRMSDLVDSEYVPSEKEPFMNERQKAYFRGKLVDWKSEILREARETLEILQQENANHPDLADRASSETDRAIELRARDRQRKLIAKIDAALQRIEDGTYGFCEETGEPISLKRLDARPIATLSLEAQERHERREKVYRDD